MLTELLLSLIAALGLNPLEKNVSLSSPLNPLHPEKLNLSIISKRETDNFKDGTKRAIRVQDSSFFFQPHETKIKNLDFGSSLKRTLTLLNLLQFHVRNRQNLTSLRNSMSFKTNLRNNGPRLYSKPTVKYKEKPPTNVNVEWDIYSVFPFNLGQTISLYDEASFCSREKIHAKNIDDLSTIESTLVREDSFLNLENSWVDCDVISASQSSIDDLNTSFISSPEHETEAIDFPVTHHFIANDIETCAASNTDIIPIIGDGSSPALDPSTMPLDTYELSSENPDTEDYTPTKTEHYSTILTGLEEPSASPPLDFSVQISSTIFPFFENSEEETHLPDPLVSTVIPSIIETLPISTVGPSTSHQETIISPNADVASSLTIMPKQYIADIEPPLITVAFADFLRAGTRSTHYEDYNPSNSYTEAYHDALLLNHRINRISPYRSCVSQTYPLKRRPFPSSAHSLLTYNIPETYRSVPSSIVFTSHKKEATNSPVDVGLTPKQALASLAEPDTAIPAIHQEPTISSNADAAPSRIITPFQYVSRIDPPLITVAFADFLRAGTRSTHYEDYDPSNSYTEVYHDALLLNHRINRISPYRSCVSQTYPLKRRPFPSSAHSLLTYNIPETYRSVSPSIVFTSHKKEATNSPVDVGLTPRQALTSSAEQNTAPLMSHPKTINSSHPASRSSSKTSASFDPLERFIPNTGFIQTEYEKHLSQAGIKPISAPLKITPTVNQESSFRW